VKKLVVGFGIVFSLIGGIFAYRYVKNSKEPSDFLKN
jgi:hypothetical protein